MLFEGVRLLFKNWRLTLVQLLPAMWIWAAMLDLKVHVIHQKSFHTIRGRYLIPAVAVIAVITAASFFLNAVFAFAISSPGRPRSGPPSDRRGPTWRWSSCRARNRTALGMSTVVFDRWAVVVRRVHEHRDRRDDGRLRVDPLGLIGMKTPTRGPTS